MRGGLRMWEGDCDVTTGIKNNTRNAMGRSEVGGVSADVMLSVAEVSGRARAAKSTAGIKNNTRDMRGGMRMRGEWLRVYFYIPARRGCDGVIVWGLPQERGAVWSVGRVTRMG